MEPARSLLDRLDVEEVAVVLVGELLTEPPPAQALDLLLKQVLNIPSTVVRGRLGRYERNIMTWVSPTNGKLVDRATRYVEHLLAGAGHVETRYEEIVRQLFAEMDVSEPGESVVLRTYRALSRRRRSRLRSTTA